MGGSGSGRTNALLNLINTQPDIYKIYANAKDPYEAKYQYLIKKNEKVRLKQMIIKLLLNTQIISKMFIKILKNIIQERSAKY